MSYSESCPHIVTYTISFYAALDGLARFNQDNKSRLYTYIVPNAKFQKTQTSQIQELVKGKARI
jgi:hypothetical protein